jgi:hypothetical protein
VDSQIAGKALEATESGERRAAMRETFDRVLRRGPALLLLVAVLAWPAWGEEHPPAAVEHSIEKGLRVFVCGHSFHIFIGNSLNMLAAEAGLKQHELVGVQGLPASEVSQHWERGGKVKAALNSGRVDVLTLSPAWKMPDEAIDKFVDLALTNSPGVRVILQQSWSGYDGADPPHRIRNNAERDGKTLDDLKPQLDRKRDIFLRQAQEINKRHRKQVVFVAPVAQAVLSLRERVMHGGAPGIQRQSELFSDALGHGKEPVKNLVSYVFFACIYHRNPAGMKAFKKDGNEPWNLLDDLLQKIAWETVISHGQSGVVAQQPEHGTELRMDRAGKNHE